MSKKTTESNLELFVKKCQPPEKENPKHNSYCSQYQTELKKPDYIYKIKDTFLLPKYVMMNVLTGGLEDILEDSENCMEGKDQ